MLKIKNLLQTLLFAGASVCLLSCKQSKPASPEAILAFENVMPKPATSTLDGKTFTLTKETNIVVVATPEEEVLEIGKYLSGKLHPATGYDLAVIKGNEGVTTHSIYLEINNDNKLGAEGYELKVTEDDIRLSANKAEGLFRGVQTLRQLFSPEIELAKIKEGAWEIATGTIRDYPEYSWRGSMLDVGRHFFGVEDVKRYIDLIAFYKMNVMHLHLSDDQGWRIEIKSWPNLTAVGGSTEVGGGKGGFYTQEQYADIVAYAQRQYITVIPEIDLPGHINAALASYAELNAGTPLNIEGGRKSPAQAPNSELNGKPKPGILYTGIEVGFSTLHIEKPETFKFVDDVLRELTAMTPGPYLHIGGDEAAATKKQDYIAFINRFKTMVSTHGKKMVGWEEIAQGDIDSSTVVQHWHSADYARMAADKDAKLVLSPATKVYLDMQYDSLSKLGLHWAAYIEVDSSYNWNPATQVKGLAREQILGVEAPLWTETIKTMDDIEYMLFPRMPAIAEVGWTPLAERQWDTFKVRLGNQSKRWQAMDINFYHSPKVTWIDK